MRVTFDAKTRDDGTMFVTSAQIPMFSCIAKDNDWVFVFDLAAQAILANSRRGINVVEAAE